MLYESITFCKNARFLVCLNKKEKATIPFFEEYALDKWKNACYNKTVTLSLQHRLEACNT